MRLLDDAEEFSPRRRMRVFLLTMIILKKKRESPTPRDKKSTHRYIYTVNARERERESKRESKRDGRVNRRVFKP